MKSSLGIFLKGYPYFQDKFKNNKTHIIQTRLFLKKAIVFKGEAAAKIFYDQEKFERKGATPKRFKKTLLGQGGVQGLDGSEHFNRKKMFMEIMNEDSLSHLQKHFEYFWRLAQEKWKTSENIILFDEAEMILNQAACKWIGIPLQNNEVKDKTSLLSSMIDGSGAIGLRHYRGRRVRKKAEKWIIDLVDEARNSTEIKNLPETIFTHFCFYENLQYKRLDKKVVAVEILNLIRPIVAIARYILFTALAIHEHPHYRKKIVEDNNDLDRCFIQEVRRFYPFFPVVAAKVKKSFNWNGYNFPVGRRVLLDLYATNHDEDIWTNAQKFYPERFFEWNKSAFNFIPQGGGDHSHNHRCAGEWITINLTQRALGFLIEEMNYIVPTQQNLQINTRRIPALPKSRFKIKLLDVAL